MNYFNCCVISQSLNLIHKIELNFIDFLDSRIERECLFQRTRKREKSTRLCKMARQNGNKGEGEILGLGLTLRSAAREQGSYNKA